MMASISVSGCWRTRAFRSAIKSWNVGFIADYEGRKLFL
jgi:hypothetical protein